MSLGDGILAYHERLSFCASWIIASTSMALLAMDLVVPLTKASFTPSMLEVKHSSSFKQVSELSFTYDYWHHLSLCNHLFMSMRVPTCHNCLGDYKTECQRAFQPR